MVTVPASRFKRSLLSLRLSLGGAFFFVVLLTSLLLGAILYSSVHTFIRNDLRARLRNAAGVAALQIDPEEHGRIRTAADERSREYSHIRAQLQAIRARSRDVRYIYTFRRDAAGRIEFVVDAETDTARVSHVGEVYPGPTPDMLAIFRKPYAAHVDKKFVTDRWGTFISSFAPMLGPDGQPFGGLGMDVSAGDLASFEGHFLRVALGSLLGISLVVMAFGLFLSQRLSRPLTDLAMNMGRIQNFDLESDIQVNSRISEIAQMKTALDNMKKGLRSFKRYVPADLVSELIHLQKEAALGAEKRPLTTLFSDIEGFTTISESMPAEKLADCLGVYFEGMTSLVLAERGTVDKFIGDAIMAFWGAPHPAGDQASRACRAALRCQEFIDERFGRLRRDGEPPFRTRIGINTGEAYVGNFGYKDRLSYTAMGDSVNLASRLEGMNKQYGTRILISEGVLAAAGSAFLTRPVDRVAVKGKSQGVMVHELVGEPAAVRPERRQFLERFRGAMALYQARKWRQAAALFGELSAADPSDGPVRILGERCRGFIAVPPPEDWNGVFALHEK
jgi:adenylate cyclase